MASLQQHHVQALFHYAPLQGLIQDCHSWLQVFSKCAQVRDTVGLANCGISSSVAKDMHKKQGIYGTPAMA